MDENVLRQLKMHGFILITDKIIGFSITKAGRYDLRKVKELKEIFSKLFHSYSYL